MINQINSLDKIITIRHGGYVSNSGLSIRGYYQILELVNKLRPIINNKKVIIFSSKVNRATESAKIIKNELDIDVIETEILGTGLAFNRDFAKVMALIQAYEVDFDIIILMTHLSYVDNFPSYYALEAWGKQLYYTGTIREGQAVINHISDKKISFIY